MAIVGNFLKSKLILLKPNWITIAQSFPDFTGIFILIDIFMLPNIIWSLQMPLCKIRFWDYHRQRKQFKKR